jgi:hypothetical protein
MGQFPLGFALNLSAQEVNPNVTKVNSFDVKMRRCRRCLLLSAATPCSSAARCRDPGQI